MGKTTNLNWCRISAINSMGAWFFPRKSKDNLSTPQRIPTGTKATWDVFVRMNHVFPIAHGRNSGEVISALFKRRLGWMFTAGSSQGRLVFLCFFVWKESEKLKPCQHGWYWYVDVLGTNCLELPVISVCLFFLSRERDILHSVKIVYQWFRIPLIPAYHHLFFWIKPHEQWDILQLTLWFQK